MIDFSNKKSLGAWGEKIAGVFLEKHGFQIVQTNYRCIYGEIDIIAREHDNWCFIEVKSRHSSQYGTGLQAITQAKQKHMIKATMHYLNESCLEDIPVRFDVVAIDFVSHSVYNIDWIPNAFSMEN